MTETHDGFHVHLSQILPGSLSTGTAQTAGMQRLEAISNATVGSKNLWMGETHVAPSTGSGNHHHGVSETGIYVVSGHPEFVFRDQATGSVECTETEPGHHTWAPPHVMP